MRHEDKMEQTLKACDRLSATIRSTIGDVPVQLFHTFIVAAKNQGKGLVELANMTGASTSTMSRHLLDLSDRLRNGADGYGLLQRTQDPTNLRVVTYTLTPKGKLFLNQLADALER